MVHSTKIRRHKKGGLFAPDVFFCSDGQLGKEGGSRLHTRLSQLFFEVSSSKRYCKRVLETAELLKLCSPTKMGVERFPKVVVLTYTFSCLTVPSKLESARLSQGARHPLVPSFRVCHCPSVETFLRSFPDPRQSICLCP